jgi:signal transduction histidine kinase
MRTVLGVALCACAWVSYAQNPLRLGLEQAGSRRPQDFGPVHEGRKVVVRGQVSGRPVRFYTAKYSLLGIQDGSRGLVLEGPEDRFDKLLPGHWIEAAGFIASRAGMPVLLPDSIAILGRTNPPHPVPVDAGGARRFAVLGRLVTAEFTVEQLGENAGGIYLTVGPSADPLKIYAPLPAANIEWRFGGIRSGDRVRVTGLASQYCPLPPHNRRFEILIHSPADVVRVDGSWMLPLWTWGVLGAAGLATLLVLWLRERRHRRQREMLRRVYELGEEILGSAALPDILKSISGPVPRVFRVTSVRLYIYNRNAKTLDPVSEGELAEPSISIDGARKGVEAGVVSCFRNRTLLSIPDIARSPFAPEPEAGGGPRAMLLIPMFAQGETIGVMQLAHEREARTFTPVERMVAQHLANQAGVAIKLLEQRSMREQLSRTEKVAAIGRLISGVANELQAPLSSIESLSERALAGSVNGGQVLEDIHTEARRAAAIVNRLVSFERPEQVDSRPLDLNRLLRSFMEFRELEWKARGIHVRNFLREGPLWVLGSQGQLEQVFLSLVVYAEQALADSGEKVISMGSNLLARRVLAEIAFSSPAQHPEDPFAANGSGGAGTLDLAVCRSIIAGHEGEIRLTRARESEWRFEIELPWSSRDTETRAPRGRAAKDSSRQLTALLIEADNLVARQLTKLLGERAYRVVPVRSAEEGMDLAQRLTFDALFCASRAPGLNWVELMHRTRSKVGAFVLLTDAYDSQLAAAAREEGYFVLSKPIEENQLDHILDHLTDPEPSRRGVTIR